MESNGVGKNIGLCPLRVTDTRLCLDSISYYLGLELRRRCMQFCATGANASTAEVGTNSKLHTENKSTTFPYFINGH